MKCDLQDFLELACTFRMHICVLVDSNREYRGRADTLEYNNQRQECLVLATDDGEKTRINIDRLKSMRALDDNPHFDIVHF